MGTIKRIFIILITLCLILSVGCVSKNGEKNENMTVAVSIPPLKDIVRNICGEKINLVVMIPPGNSPANYAPSPEILMKLEDASVYFAIGVPAEEANIKPKAKNLNKNLRIVDLNKAADLKYPERLIQGKRDPHVWLSPKRVKVMVEKIVSELSEIDPENSTLYKNNGEKYKSAIDKTDSEIKNKLDKLLKKEFLIYHPALGYFAEEYGLKMTAVEKSGKEASIKQLKSVIDYAKDNNLKTVFYQAQFDKKQAQIIANEIKGEVKQVDPLAGDYLNNLLNITDSLLESESR